MNIVGTTRLVLGLAAGLAIALWLQPGSAACEVLPPVEEGVTVGPEARVVTAIERFTIEDGLPSSTDRSARPPQTVTTPPLTTPAPASPELALAVAYCRDHLRNVPGFVGALVLNGQRGELAVYSQWRPRGSTPTTLRTEWSVASALMGSRAALVDARTFVVDFSAPDERSLFTPAGPTHAHFGIFTMAPADQERLLALARANAPGSIGTPGLVAINFHRSLDGGEVINLGGWTSFDGFAELLRRPGFQAGAPYWEGVAAFENIFFDVAAVVSPPIERCARL